jgi:hypothetical protein
MSAKCIWETLAIQGIATCEAFGLQHELEDRLPQSKACIVLNDESELSVTELPLHLEDFYLQGIYGPTMAKFRWEETFTFQEMHADEESRWEWAIYVRKESSDQVLNLVKKSLTSQCEFVKCSVHNKPLCKVKRQKNSQCCLPRCKNQVSYKCLEGFPNTMCQTGICRRHCKEWEDNQQPSYVSTLNAQPTQLEAQADSNIDL